MDELFKITFLCFFGKTVRAGLFRFKYAFCQKAGFQPLFYFKTEFKERPIFPAFLFRQTLYLQRQKFRYIK